MSTYPKLSVGWGNILSRDRCAKMHSTLSERLDDEIVH